MRRPFVYFCYLFATNGVFCYQFSLNFVKVTLNYNPQKIKEYLIKLKSVKQNKNGLLIRMSLVRVQLPEPRFPQFSAVFSLFAIAGCSCIKYTKTAKMGIFTPVFNKNTPKHTETALKPCRKTVCFSCKKPSIFNKQHTKQPICEQWTSSPSFAKF